MTSSETPMPFIVRILNYLPIVEKVLLTALATGTILTVMKIDVTVTRVAMVGLAFIFFLSAYRPYGVPRQEGELFGFSELLGFTILPKILWLSSAISAFGITFYLFNFGNDGYKNMLMIGGTTIAIATLLFVVLRISGTKHIGTITPILLRALPILLADTYILFK